MTERQLMNMQQLLKAAEIDCGCLTIEEVADLQQTVKNELYAQRIKDFRQLLDDILPNNDSSDEDWDKFYSRDWSVSFGGKTVTIRNDAVMYHCMRDALDEYIEDCL